MPRTDVALLSLVLVCLTASLFINAEGTSGINLSKLPPIAITSSSFLSVALDSGVIANGFWPLEFSNPQLIALAKGLGPAYLRFGETAADLLSFQPGVRDSTRRGGEGGGEVGGREEGESKSQNEGADQEELGGGEGEGHLHSVVLEDLDCCGKPRQPFIMTGAEFDSLYNFTRTVGWKLIFDLNVLLRKEGFEWDKSNARSLLTYAQERNYSNISWELGNEPNSLPHQLNFSLPAKQLGKDLQELRLLLQEFPLFSSSPIIGPDINGVRKCFRREAQRVIRRRKEVPLKGTVNDSDSFGKVCPAIRYLEEVIQAAGDGLLSAISWHHYYLNGRTANIRQFMDPFVLDSLKPQLKLVQSSVGDKEVWLGETSSAWGGGAPGLSDTWAGGYCWLDKLGMAARYRVTTVIRQSLFHGHYALLSPLLFPRPDYWLSHIYSVLVGPTVLRTVDNTGKTSRLYAHCARKSKGVLVFGLNMGDPASWIWLGDEVRVVEYLLSPVDGNLQATNVLLNGELLEMVGNQLPEVRGEERRAMKLLLPSHTVAFWEFPDVRNPACEDQVL